MMAMEQIVQHANSLTSLAERALELRADARTYRALGKVALADLLDQEAAEWEDRAREALNPSPKVAVKIDGRELQRSLLKWRRGNGGRGLGIA